MNDASAGLHTLRRPADRPGGAGAAVPMPRSRWVLRYVLPIAIVAAAALLLVRAGWEAWVPAIEVEVEPVVTRPAVGAEASAAVGGADPRPGAAPRAGSSVVAQAPGWIEPDPFAITVQSLVPGVVEAVLVLEGERVSAGDGIARLVSVDAELGLLRAQAELAGLEAAAARAAAEVTAAEARLAETRDEVERSRALVDIGAVSPGTFARLGLRAQRAQAEAEAARASHREATARIDRQHVVIREASLALERTIVRAPVDGVVLSRWVVPGTRLTAMGSDGAGDGQVPGVVRLYDPARLQVRTEVPLGDAAKVGVGTHARITTDILPDHVFHGEVTRIMHLADIQRNTMQVKVRIDEPSPLLRPDMLARVRFLGSDGAERVDGAAGEAVNDGAGGPDGSRRLYATLRAVRDRSGDRAAVWVAAPTDDGRGRRASRREITIGAVDGDLVRVHGGLRPGDRLIVDPPAGLREGARVRIRPAHDGSDRGTGEP